MIKKLTEQLMQKLKVSTEVDIHSELLMLTATLLMIKSQRLLPNEEESIAHFEEDMRIEMIQSLIEYCRFKEAAEVLSIREEEQKAFFPRATISWQRELDVGLDNLDIENLKSIFTQILQRPLPRSAEIIQAEKWQVSDKLQEIRTRLYEQQKILFIDLFIETASRIEQIVLFLAILEMMKHQEITILKENETIYVSGIKFN